MKLALLLFLIMLMTTSTELTAQARDSVNTAAPDSAPPYRSPERARRIAMLFPGAGYEYTGEYFRGYLTWVGTAGPVIVGVIGFDVPCAYWFLMPENCTSDSRWPSRVIGTAFVAAGLWTFVSSVRDARPSAERANNRHPRRVVPILTGPTGLNPAWQAGVSVGW
jgi:hypothetical protein